MTWGVIEDVAKLALISSCAFLALVLYARRRKPSWSGHFERRQVSVLFVLVLLVIARKVIDVVIDADSGPADRAILLFVHEHVPAGMNGLFEAVTLTASANAIIPLAIVATAALLWAKRRSEALLLGGSVAMAGLVIYVVKALVGRERPALWDTEWYWGSSFPSGHTLAVSAIATAGVLVAARLWPSTRRFAPWFALVWICAVATSRLVLGVHWPTDVLAAACVGATLPLAISLALQMREPAEVV